MATAKRKVTSKVSAAERNRARIGRVRSARRRLQAPLAGPKANWALRRELAVEAWGGIRDVGDLVAGPVKRRAETRTQVGKPASKRDARKHEQFKAARGDPAPTPKPAPQPTPIHADTRPRTTSRPQPDPAPAQATPSSTVRSGNVPQVVQNLMRAADEFGSVEITHADEFDELAEAMAKAMTVIGDAFDSFADQCDGLKFHPRITRHMHDAASDVADISERYKTARKTFLDEYRDYLNPPDKMPDLAFFDNAETDAA